MPGPVDCNVRRPAEPAAGLDGYVAIGANLLGAVFIHDDATLVLRDAEVNRRQKIYIDVSECRT